jgi:hypothetical protein
MSLNSLRKTRWKVDPRSISVYPYGIFYILSVCLAIAFGGLFVVNHVPQSVIITLAIILFVIGLFGSTKIVFDNESQLMQKKLFGFLPVKSIPFEKLEGINIVRNNVGGFNFRAFRKNDKFGKGTPVSAGYSKETDTNAIGFTQEVIAPVHAWLDQVPQADNTVKKPLDAYEFFLVNHTEYAVKKSKITFILSGLLFIAVGVYMQMNESVMPDANPYVKYAFVAGAFLLGLGLILGAFTKIVFDTADKVVRSVSPIGLRNREYSFTDFDGFQIVRRSTNMIYTGTDVQMYFSANNNKKAGMMVLKTFMSTKKIDRFLEETGSIIK